MISVQPILSLKYFQLRKNKLPKSVKKLFYLSWEDALWDLLTKKNIVKGSKILIPSFYCKDVERNIKLHGYKVEFYKILPNLDPDKKSFIDAIKKYNPSVIVIFHPAGIKSNLLDNQKWLAKISGNSILIEDAVHRVLNATDFKIIKRNHFIIDSLRKVIPIQGAHLYGNIDDLNFDVPNVFQSIIYRFKVNYYWFLMVMTWTIGLGKKAEKNMIKGYNIIGDSIKPSRGSVIGRLLSDRINVASLQKIKIKQVNIYEKEIKNVVPIKLTIKDSDKKHLRGYPVILPLVSSAKILKYLRSNNLLVRFELDGSDWSKGQKIIFLPLGFQMSDSQQKEVCKLVKSAFTLN